MYKDIRARYVGLGVGIVGTVQYFAMKGGVKLPGAKGEVFK